MTTAIRPLIDGLSETATRAEQARSAVDIAKSGLDVGSKASEAIGEFYDDVKKLEDLAESIESVTGVLSKFGPVGKIVDLLDRVIERVENRIEDIRKSAGKADNVFKSMSNVLDATSHGLTAVDIALANTSADIDAAMGSLTDAEAAFGVDRALLDDAQATTLEKLDALAGSLGTSSLGEAQTALGTISNAMLAMPGVVKPIKTLTQNIEAATAQLAKAMDKLAPLLSPLEAIKTALSPVSWVLDKADWLISKIVDPILDPILEKTGIIDKINDVADTITDVLPSISLFNGIPTAVASITTVLQINSPSMLLAKLEDAVIGRVFGEFGVLGELMKSGDDAANLLVGRNDMLSSTSTLSGGDDDDLLSAGDGDDVLSGGSGNDILVDGAGSDSYDGGTGIDAVYFDTVLATVEFSQDSGVVQVSHSGDVDTIQNVETLLFNDAIIDIADTEAFARIDYSSGSQRLDGSTTNDVLLGGEMADVIKGQHGDDQIFGADGADTLHGGKGADMLTGAAGHDRLYGNKGDDTLFGGEGNDKLSGGAGDDQLSGGAGRDKLTGVDGADIFIFSDADVTGDNLGDLIRDFEQGEDVIDLSGIDVVTEPGIDGGLSFVGEDGYSGSAGEVMVRQVKNKTYVEADLDGDGATDFGIRLNGVYELEVSDFVL
ncbi:MAG: M10 family metallopeptidase C-terminal domain-containing protein [Pseudomonadota bacterium]